MAYGAPAPAQDRPALPEYLGRKHKGVMDQQELASVVQGALASSVQFVDTELSFERARATEYYLGKPFGNEEDGRSQAILTELRDAVDGMSPSIMRVIFPPGEHAVEFEPDRPDTVEQAAQKTDYVRYVFEKDNKGKLKALAVLKDGLVRKIGIFKWGWDDSVDTKAFRQENIDRQQLELLAADDEVDLKNVEEIPPTKQEKAKAKETGQIPPVLYNVDFTRTIKGGKARVWEVPPEEFVFNRQARDLDTALLVAHRTDLTRGQLLAMGIDEEDIDNHAGQGNSTDLLLMGNAEEIARRDVAGVGRVVGFGYTNDPDTGTANAKILYTEAWMTLDFDGDGIAELRKICCIGPTYYPVKNDPTDERPFAVFTPYPEPHTLLGGSVADRTMDIQKVNSALLRGMLDSLSASIFPRTVYVEGQASVADIMNTAIGAPIRERVAGAVRILETSFVGKEAMPVMQFMQDVIERRVGRQGGNSLDSDALQSTDKDAVQAVIGGRQEQIEMIAWIFAETMARVFRGVGMLLKAHQPRERMVQLRGQWVQVDPRTWTDDMEVTVNVALGSSHTDKKVATLMGVLQDQMNWLQMLGPSNPMCDLPMIRNTRAKILSLQGLKDVDSYYKPFPPGWQPPPPPPPQPSPEVMAMQQEMEMNKLKTVKELAVKKDEIALKKQQMSFEQEFKIRQLAAQTEVKLAGINAQFHSDITTANLEAAISQDQKAAELAIMAHDQLHDQSLEADQQQHQQTMDQQQMAMSAPQDDAGGASGE